VIDESSHLEETGRADGYRVIQAALFARAGVQATAPDVQANEARRERVIHRRTYNITEGMRLWHMDSELTYAVLLLLLLLSAAATLCCCYSLLLCSAAHVVVEHSCCWAQCVC